MTPGRIAGIVLAAGESRRMEGLPKILLPFGSGTVLDAVIRTARRGGLQPLIVVAGLEADSVRASVERSGLPVDRVVENRGFRDGIATSLAAGLGVLVETEGVDAAVVLLGDEPGVRAEAIRAAVGAWVRTGAPVVRAVYRDRPGHPVLLSRATFDVARELRGNSSLVDQLGAAGFKPFVAKLPMEAPIDVDTPADYRRALESSAGASP